MPIYKKLYEKYEQTQIHRTTAEVNKAEADVDMAIQNLKGSVPESAIFELDMLIGALARAYEKQGFAFAMEVTKV